jgi:hypothetical protein
LPLAIGKGITLRGFIVRDHMALLPEFPPQPAEWLRDGYRE